MTVSVCTSKEMIYRLEVQVLSPISMRSNSEYYSKNGFDASILF